jgi:FkbM family methyltransferase
MQMFLKAEQLPGNFFFLPYGLDKKTGYVNFNLPINDSYVSGSMVLHANVKVDNYVKVPMKSFADITSVLGHNHIDLLKIDIEGSEFDVIPSVLETGIYINQILIEVHERFFPDGKEKIHCLLDQMRSYGYRIFAVSDSYEEISFININ